MTILSTAVIVTTASPLRAIKAEVYRLMGISPTAKHPSKAVKDVYGYDLRYRANWETILTLEQDKVLCHAFRCELTTRPVNQAPAQRTFNEPNDLDPNQFAITVTSDSQHAVKWHDQVIGLIQASPELGTQWEYVRYSRYPETFKGSYFECCGRARQDYENLHEPLHSVINTDYFPLANQYWMFYPTVNVVLNGEFMGSRAAIESK